ncbi:MAG TPA: fatty acid-binding protein DegV [Syntrophomonas sp.]|nr:fatty acid-binding protein DegV [Syntrophomonas sp.]
MKEKIALLTDSACDIPQELIKKLNIKMLPLKIIYPGKEYSDRVDISPQDVYDKMPDEIPTTSMPCLGEIKSTIEKIKNEGFTHLLAVHISSGLSGTFQAVQMAANDIDNMIVKVIDTKTLSIAQGWMVLDAAKNIGRGLSFDKVVDQLYKLKPKVQVYYVLETLEYLRRGGRIGKVAGMLGEFLHLKPIISVDEEGKYYTYCKARGRKKSIERLIQIVEDNIKDKPAYLAVMHGGARKEAEEILARLSHLTNVKEIITSDISPALGVHTGPGLLGVSFYEV